MTNTVSATVIFRKRKEARSLALGFYIVAGLVVADLILRNFGGWRFTYRSWWDFYVLWEGASIAFTIIATWLYWRKYISTGDETAYADVLSADNKKFHVFGLIILSAFALIGAGAIAFGIALSRDSKKDVTGIESADITSGHTASSVLAWIGTIVHEHAEFLLLIEAGCLTLGVLCLVSAQLKIVKAAPLAKQRASDAIVAKAKLLAGQTDPELRAQVQMELDTLTRKRNDYDDILDDVGKVLAYSDAPIGAAFFVIFLVVGAHYLGWTGADSRLLPPFIAGAVALQLLYSNFVFYVEANGAFPRWATRFAPALSGLTPVIEGHRGAPTRIDNSSSDVEPKLATMDRSKAETEPEVHVKS